MCFLMSSTSCGYSFIYERKLHNALKPLHCQPIYFVLKSKFTLKFLYILLRVLQQSFVCALLYLFSVKNLWNAFIFSWENRIFTTFKKWACPDSNRGPLPCEGSIIATRQQARQKTIYLFLFFIFHLNDFSLSFSDYPCRLTFIVAIVITLPIIYLKKNITKPKKQITYKHSSNKFIKKNYRIN